MDRNVTRKEKRLRGQRTYGKTEEFPIVAYVVRNLHKKCQEAIYTNTI